MPDKPRKTVHADNLIGKVLEAYLSGSDVRRQTGVVSAGLFLYFMLPDRSRAIVDGFYESWRNSRQEQHFYTDSVSPGPPLVGLWFSSGDIPAAFCELLVTHLTEKLADLRDETATEIIADSSSHENALKGKAPTAKPRPKRPKR